MEACRTGRVSAVGHASAADEGFREETPATFGTASAGFDLPVFAQPLMPMLIRLNRQIRRLSVALGVIIPSSRGILPSLVPVVVQTTRPAIRFLAVCCCPVESAAMANFPYGSCLFLWDPARQRSNGILRRTMMAARIVPYRHLVSIEPIVRSMVARDRPHHRSIPTGPPNSPPRQ